MTQAQTARFTIGIESHRTNNLRQFTSGDTANRIHLPHAILRGDKALQHHRIFYGCRGDVRNAETVSRYGGFAGDRHRDGSSGLRQRAPQEPPNGHRKHDQQNRYAQINRSHEPAVGHCG
ncbi:MAG: hypothetical protein ABSB67_01190 [Bryobacteraceae bacterium]